MNSHLTSSLLVVLISALFATTVAQTCRGAKTVTWRDPRGVTHNYLFSWEDPSTSRLQVTWDNAQAACKQHCMNLVSLETPAENDFIKQRIAAGSQRYIWTSGRRCFSCNHITGWQWRGTGQRLGATNNRANGDWSHTGGARKPQPDNRENTPGDFGFRGYEEECLSILNNFYNDGIKWHDVACYHTKPFVCESG